MVEPYSLLIFGNWFLEGLCQCFPIVFSYQPTLGHVIFGEQPPQVALRVLNRSPKIALVKWIIKNKAFNSKNIFKIAFKKCGILKKSANFQETSQLNIRTAEHFEMFCKLIEKPSKVVAEKLQKGQWVIILLATYQIISIALNFLHTGF